MAVFLKWLLGCTDDCKHKVGQPTANACATAAAARDTGGVIHYTGGVIHDCGTGNRTRITLR